jgi:hypothetical protein
LSIHSDSYFAFSDFHLVWFAAAPLQEAKGNASSGPDTHDKKQRRKGAAKDIDTPPKVKKMRLSDTHQSTYRKYIGHIRKVRPQKKGVPP